MIDTPQPRTPFAHRLTPEVRAEWEACQAAGRRADRAYRDEERDQRFWTCERCHKQTDRATRLHKKCEAAA